MGEGTRAVSIYEGLRANGDGAAETDLNLLQALVAAGELDKAEALVSELETNKIPERSYRTILGVLRFRQNRFDEALFLLDKVLTENPADREALFQRGRCRSLRQNIEGALEGFQSLEALGEGSARLRTYGYFVRQQAALWNHYDDDVGFLSKFNDEDEPNCQNPFFLPK